MDLFAGFEPDELLTMDDFDSCIVGIVERYGQEPIVCYDRDKVLAELQAQGMDYEGALEFFEFNQLGSWVGDRTPCFITLNGTEQS